MTTYDYINLTCTEITPQKPINMRVCGGTHVLCFGAQVIDMIMLYTFVDTEFRVCVILCAYMW